MQVLRLPSEISLASSTGILDWATPSGSQSSQHFVMPYKSQSMLLTIIKLNGETAEVEKVGTYEGAEFKYEVRKTD
ncbi:hypothetical protein AMATHDRAFT_10949 [Amanita thiersii Skay4041]|uniref:Uncharacterized protein n=1 Tax=Amanita thiersii Skay4041 TaxID=703135 RepID=A0A2A9NAL4_9AGAR|nr:hypothetical protein AMATHDRAFT_10949 [Amanita thiersii Skay4041]